MQAPLAPYRSAVRQAVLVRRVGRVRQAGGLAVEVEGLRATLGELCTIAPLHGLQQAGERECILAEVVGIRSDGVVLMPYGRMQGVAAGCEVVADGHQSRIDVGDGLLGRVIDGFGTPLDDLPQPKEAASARAPCSA